MWNSPVKGDEEYTWWLNPNLIGACTFPLAGIPAAPAPIVLRHGERSAAHLTSGARVEQAQFDGRQLTATEGAVVRLAWRNRLRHRQPQG
jgi:hypothetical protein